MIAAGYILTGLRKYRRRAHSPAILAYNLRSEFFGVEELASWYPEFENFTVWPATTRLLWKIRRTDRPEIAGQSTLEHFGHWYDRRTRRITLCTKKEARQAKLQL